MENKRNILLTFPTAVLKNTFHRDLNAEEINFIMSLEKRYNIRNIASVDNFILEKPILKDIKEFILSELNHYFKEIVAPENNQVVPIITQSWTNHTKRNQSHHIHRHPNSFLSGVFYIKANKQIDKINLRKNYVNNIKIATNKPNLFNSEDAEIYVGSGDLIIFPSYIDHYVNTKHDDEERISLAFNSFFKGQIGSKDGLTYLNI